MTLIEVLAAITLLVMLLGVVVVASSRHTRQLRFAQDRLIAQEVAEALLRRWLVDQDGQIEQPRGRVADRPGWEWRLSGRSEPGLEPLGFHVGRLQIVRPATAGDRFAAPQDTIVLATVEFASSSVITARDAARGTR